MNKYKRSRITDYVSLLEFTTKSISSLYEDIDYLNRLMDINNKLILEMGGRDPFNLRNLFIHNELSYNDLIESQISNLHSALIKYKETLKNTVRLSDTYYALLSSLIYEATPFAFPYLRLFYIKEGKLWTTVYGACYLTMLTFVRGVSKGSYYLSDEYSILDIMTIVESSYKAISKYND